MDYYENSLATKTTITIPATPDGVLPVEYQTAFDPLDVLAYVAGNTRKITLGTSIVNMFYYTPIMLAKSYATLDVLSQGRVIAGLGLGWSKDEYQASNIPFANRLYTMVLITNLLPLSVSPLY